MPYIFTQVLQTTSRIEEDDLKWIQDPWDACGHFQGVHENGTTRWSFSNRTDNGNVTRVETPGEQLDVHHWNCAIARREDQTLDICIMLGGGLSHPRLFVQPTWPTYWHRERSGSQQIRLFYGQLNRFFPIFLCKTPTSWTIKGLFWGYQTKGLWRVTCL